MIDEARIESDERGFELVLAGDFSDAIARYITGSDGVLALRLPQDAAIKLAASVRDSLDPWVAEMEYYRAAYARATPEERAAILGLADEPEDRVELALAAADHERKRRKEER